MYNRFAIKKGYRHIDCAKIYLNEKEVGEVFAEIIDKTVPRKELFIVGKVGCCGRLIDPSVLHIFNS